MKLDRRSHKERATLKVSPVGSFSPRDKGFSPSRRANGHRVAKSRRRSGSTMVGAALVLFALAAASFVFIFRSQAEGLTSYVLGTSIKGEGELYFEHVERM